jgi:hypothetical protein
MRSSFRSRRRLIAALAVLVVAVVVGIAYGYLAGIAVALVAITILLLVVGSAAGMDAEIGMGENWGRGRWGSEDDDSRRNR